MRNPSIRLIAAGKRNFIPLLLLGDEQESSIDQYLERSDLFALFDGGLKCVCAVTDEGQHTLEIQNLATDRRYQRQGYAALMIKHLSVYYGGRYQKMCLGTGDVPTATAFTFFKETW
ncbi:MAG: GNAT family N-acetyltransferase [Oscillospiraceae bacterium]|nr:GNAT family N-acetyltransferase [Oscillospiraceae bacterium]